MLQRLHEKVHGWLAWVVVIIIGSTFVLFGVSYYANSRSSNNIKATVNEQDITLREYDQTYRRLKQQTRQINASTEQVLKTQAINQLVLDNIMQQAGSLNGFKVSTNQVQDAIVSTEEFQDDGSFSNQKFQQLLSSNMLTQSSYFDLVKNGMMNNQVRFSFIGTSFLLPNELQRFIQYANQKRNYNYLVIKPQSMVIKNQPTDVELNNYYKENQTSFKTEEQVSLSYILLSMKQEMQQTKISVSEIKSFYEENKASYMTPARYKLDRIFIKGNIDGAGKASKDLQTKIKNIKDSLKTMSFSNISKKYSDDLLSDKDDASWLTIGMLEKNIGQELTTLKVDGVSSAIYMKNGVEFIKLVAKQPSKLTPLADVKQSIETSLRSEQAQKSFQQKAEHLADLSYQNPDRLSVAADELSLQIHKTKLSSRNLNFAAPLNYGSVLNAAFKDDVLIEHNNSQPIQINDDAIVVIRISDHKQSKLKPFAEVKSQINQLLVNDQKLKQARELALSLVKEISDSKLAVTLKTNNLSWLNANSVLRTQTDGLNSLINNFAFELPFTKKAITESKLLANGDIAVVQLNSVIDGTLKDVNKSQQKLLENKLASNNGIKSYDLYVQALRKKATVKIIQ